MKPDKGRAMPVSLVRLHAFKPKPDQLYIIPILRLLYNVGSFIFLKQDHRHTVSHFFGDTA